MNKLTHTQRQLHAALAEQREMLAVIAALVDRLGGSVTLDRQELAQALELERCDQPDSIEIKVRRMAEHRPTIVVPG